MPLIQTKEPIPTMKTRSLLLVCFICFGAGSVLRGADLVANTPVSEEDFETVIRPGMTWHQVTNRLWSRSAMRPSTNEVAVFYTTSNGLDSYASGYNVFFKEGRVDRVVLGGQSKTFGSPEMLR